jgi:hypothetical protein
MRDQEYSPYGGQSTRQRRRHIERRLRKLMKRHDTCSICGQALPHNSRTIGGLDARGELALVGECCAHHIREIILAVHDYDFFPRPGKGKGGRKADSPEQIVKAIAAYQAAVAGADKELEGIELRGGMTASMPRAQFSVLDHPWKDDDRQWFEQHPSRAHRVRLPFAGEIDDAKASVEVPLGHELLLAVRQVEPGKRLRVGFFADSTLIPMPDDEGLAHTLFEIATRHEDVPRSGEALNALIDKYSAVHEA